MKNKNSPTPLSNLEPNSESYRLSEESEGYDSLQERVTAGQKMLLSNEEVNVMAIVVLLLYLWAVPECQWILFYDINVS